MSLLPKILLIHYIPLFFDICLKPKILKQTNVICFGYCLKCRITTNCEGILLQNSCHSNHYWENKWPHLIINTFKIISFLSIQFLNHRDTHECLYNIIIKQSSCGHSRQETRNITVLETESNWGRRETKPVSGSVCVHRCWLGTRPSQAITRQQHLVRSTIKSLFVCCAVHE